MFENQKKKGPDLDPIYSIDLSSLAGQGLSLESKMGAIVVK